jgi:ABC-type multidrug transport system fused ATPase/permease subunit
MTLSFTLQDILGSFLAFFLFSLVFVIPGYVLGWGLNLFDFRNRLLAVRYLLGIVLSNVLSPILLFLVYFFLGAKIAILLVFMLAIAWGLIEFLPRGQGKPTPSLSPDAKRYQRIAIAVAGAWVVFSIFLLVDIQFGQKLYFSIVSYDFSTRVSVIDAITRTGVPPVNPGYFPGQPVLLTQLYYFWYILGSCVDQLGGSWVSPRQAMIASVAWSGLGLLATLALYLRFRDSNREIGRWRASLLAPQLLMISGLDAIPVIVISVTGRIVLGFNPLDGYVEGWNTPVMSWMNALAWVPHHIAGALACITALMLFLYAINKDKSQLPSTALISGIAFASAVGLSLWTMFVFAFFWVLWMVVLFLKREDRKVLWMMIVAAVLGLVLVSPFLVGVLQSGNSGDGTGLLPVKIYVRPFIASSFVSFLPQWALNILNLLFLPINYLFELGFYLAIALLWYQTRKTEWKHNPYFLAETLLVLTVVVLLSFMRSTIIAINDLGIRGWLFGQFILVIWAVDVLERPLKNKTLLSPSIFNRFPGSRGLSTALSLMFVVGILTTSLEIISIRVWPMLIDTGVAGFPTGLSPDTQLGRRTYSARLAYQFISKHVPENTIIQYNPTTLLDRPSGLYGNHQMAVADRTAYGIATDEFQFRVEKIGAIFQKDTYSDWNEIDKLCHQYYIDVLVFKDTDPAWQGLDILMPLRPALYANQFYAVLSCGSFSQTGQAKD